MSKLASRTQKRKKKGKKVLLLISLISVLLLVGCATYVTLKIANVTSNVQVALDRGDKSEKRVEAVDPSKDNISILLLGEDRRPDEPISRTDAIMVATFNKSDNSIILTNIPRDTRVNIAGRDRMDKINHAHAFGGVNMIIDSVEQFLDIPIDYFIRVDFQAFIAIVDAIGGIEVEVPFDFTERGTDRVWYEFYEGMQHLNGEEALAYTRMRKQDPRGDIGRGQRQQQVMQAIIEKSASIQSIARFDDVLEAIADNISLNLSFGNMVALHSYASSLNSIEQLQIKGNNSTINGVYYYEPVPESVVEISTRLQEHLGLIEPQPVYGVEPSTDGTGTTQVETETEPATLPTN
ncbi:LCP family glycopolymer transferase [Alkalihalobacterium chitinilyticum]|uniref:LCP family protein n=1 Tax=Alkalihalobacterium chitinilyticum TaxID=2980103 RepID=A0ABT5VKK0_9BACI|nr:LCP family protein [Alkalihalobacterium chitinilyticum]MDE5415832.1 LCP family protein [Alkalihalobacterium chitinilyticum]